MATKHKFSGQKPYHTFSGNIITTQMIRRQVLNWSYQQNDIISTHSLAVHRDTPPLFENQKIIIILKKKML